MFDKFLRLILFVDIMKVSIGEHCGVHRVTFLCFFGSWCHATWVFGMSRKAQFHSNDPTNGNSEYGDN